MADPFNLVDSKGKQRIRLFAEAAECQLGGNGMGGVLLLNASAGSNPSPATKAIIFLSADLATVGVGGEGKVGNIYVRDEADKTMVHIDGNADIKAGGDGKSGEVMLFSAVAKNPKFPDSPQHPSIHLRADWGRIRAGSGGTNGDLVLFAGSVKNPDSDNEASIYLVGGEASIRAGGNGLNGSLVVLNAANKPVVEIDGKSGDILMKNADCAEDFDVDDPALEPGSVLILGDEAGRLRVSDEAYDTRVAGILSGAGDYRPAIVLDRKSDRKGRRPVALVGKVWCKVEAQSAPIRIGSLLTTSSLPGHAMAATDRERAFGAVLGKALAPLATGIGIVPVLVSLQ
jgi:hypothetical protein